MSGIVSPSFLLSQRQSMGRLILVVGNFNILHPGHVRLLRFAKECGDTLVVGVNAESLINDPSYNEEEHRVDIVNSLSCVDYCFVNECTSGQLVEMLQPYAVVKGKEFEGKSNPELEALKACGGRLIFSSGDTSLKSSSYFNQKPAALLDKEKLNGYMQRHELDANILQKRLHAFTSLNVVVFGDCIVDEYLQCSAVGMSQEDPTIVVTPDESKSYLGGAAITAAHAKGMGANNVSFFTVVGKDESADFVREKSAAYGLNAFVYTDASRPTTRKRRYRVGNKTLLRVNEVRDHDVGIDIQEQIWSQVLPELKRADLVVFSDFNYGALPQALVDKITDFCLQNQVMLSADSQTSSQVGDISRFKNVDLVTPTEKEIRVALNNTRDGLVTLAEKLRQTMNCKNIVVTLADEGALLHKPEDGGAHWQNDKVAALAANVIDPAGAGDCLLAATSMAMASGAELWEASLLGAVAAACQVSRIGNQPMSSSQLEQVLVQL